MTARIFAKLEPGFLQDHRMMMLPSECKVAYLGFWTRAVYEGKERLTSQECDPKVMARWADVRPSAVRTLLELCKNMERPLLELDSNGAVTVCGASLMHPRLVKHESDREEKRREEKKKRRVEETKTKPATTKEGLILEAIFADAPDRLRDPDAAAESIREALDGRSWNLSLEAKACRVYHEGRNPGKKHIWATCLKNWAQIYARGEVNRRDMTRADLEADRAQRRKEADATII